MMGYCPICSTQTFEIKEGKLGRPLGNYRSIKFYMTDGKYLEVPMCLTCYDSWNEGMSATLPEKLGAYMKSCAPDTWDEKKKNEYAERFSSRKVAYIKKKLGALRKIDREAAQIWQ